MKRSMLIKHNDGTADTKLELGKAVTVDANSDFVFMEKMKDGKWRLTVSKSLIEDISKVSSFEIYRED